MFVNIILPTICGYVIGSIPIAVWLGKLRFRKDVRELGSGNPGATNVYRSWGIGWAVLVFVLDALKGIIGVVVCIPAVDSMESWWLGGVVAAALLLGHQYPLFSRFQGGRGVSTAAGILLVLHPAILAAGVLTFGWTIAFTRRVSLGSMVAVTTVLLLAVGGWAIQGQPPQTLIISLTIWVLLIWGHRENIGRLLEGREPPIGS